MRKLEHHAAALSSPLLLPIIQKIGNQTPAHAYETLFGYYFLAYRHCQTVLSLPCLCLQCSLRNWTPGLRPQLGLRNYIESAAFVPSPKHHWMTPTVYITGISFLRRNQGLALFLHLWLTWQKTLEASLNDQSLKGDWCGQCKIPEDNGFQPAFIIPLHVTITELHFAAAEVVNIPPTLYAIRLYWLICLH